MPRQHGKDGVYRRVIVTVLALALGGYFVLGPSPVSAQQPNPQNQQKKVAPKPQAKPQVIRPQNVPRRPQTATPRTVKPTTTTTRRVTTPKTVTPKVVTPKPGPKVVAPKPGPKVVAPKPGPKVVAPKTGSKVVVAGRIRSVPARGAGRTRIHGRNYSVWRSGYRFRHHGRWRTFVAISALSAIAIGTASYYPYAYITAPEPYCDGLTEDGCEMRWQEVETVEGDLIAQCVAYCPWR